MEMEPTIKKPIKRSKELTPLSKEHHDGLLLCWKIRMGIKNNIVPERIAGYVLSYYEADLKKHFRQEEEYLFPLLPDTDELKAMALAQHAEIKEKIAALKTKAGNVLLDEVANKLDEHIRFEERQLFGHIESVVDPAVLKHLGVKLNDISKKHCEHTWQDEFWVNKN